MPDAWVRPPLYLQHGIHSVYHVYRDDNAQGGILDQYYYTLDPLGDERAIFDVREVRSRILHSLPGERGHPLRRRRVESDKDRREIIKYAIDTYFFDDPDNRFDWDGRPQRRFTNHYRCTDCNVSWEDDDCDAMHNDRCPKCNHEIEPESSEDHSDYPATEELVEFLIAYGHRTWDTVVRRIPYVALATDQPTDEQLVSWATENLHFTDDVQVALIAVYHREACREEAKEQEGPGADTADSAADA